MKRFLLSAAVLTLIAASGLWADDVYIGLESGGQGIGVGLAPVASASSRAEEKALAERLEDVIRYDLAFSRSFRLITDGPALPKGQESKELERWGSMGADAVVWARLALGQGMFRLETRIIETSSKKPISNKIYTAASSDWRDAAHQFSDDVVLHFTGQPGIAHSKITFVNTSTGYKEIAVVDYDGENFQRLTNDRSIALLPKWLPKGEEVAFTSWKRRTPQLYVLTVASRAVRTLSAQQGLNMTPAWAPDGSGIVMTLSIKSEAKLFLTDLQGRVIRPLTGYGGIETAPTFAPSSREIAFTTDRPGTPQIYVMDKEGTNLRRLTNMKWCDSPVWSPRGNEIAFTGRESNRFDVFIMDVTGSSVRHVTENAGDNENPSWSPDGRFLVFSSNRNGKKELFIMSADGAYQHRIGPFPGASLTPNWGP